MCHIITRLAVVLSIVSLCCHANTTEGIGGRETSFRLELRPNHKEPFIQALVPQLVLIEIKEGHLREKERERETEYG